VWPVVRTLVISDLHLGAPRGSDLLRLPAPRAALLAALAGIERLVILGDLLELRETAERDAAAFAAPLLRELGETLGRDGELVIVAGNHDHALAGGWIDARLGSEPPGFLTLEQRVAPELAGPLPRRLAELAAPARVSFAYPGIWLREDVYALHGHYADLHATVPTFERVFAGAMRRYVVSLPEHDATPDDYEAVLAPLYAWMLALARRSDHAVLTAGGGASAGAWRTLTASDRHRRPLRSLALGGGYAGAVAALNRLGIGPLERDLSAGALCRGYLTGMSELVRRLGIDADHVLFGHSHRPGPHGRDDAIEWIAAGGVRLHNTGSWVHQPHFLGADAAGSTQWPGTAILLEPQGPPRLLHLLDGFSHAQLRPQPAPA